MFILDISESLLNLILFLIALHYVMFLSHKYIVPFFSTLIKRYAPQK